MPIVGDVLADRYRLESVLGVGGMASVYRATDLRLDRQVAVKVLAANLAADARFAERFNREAGAMAGFSHPNVAAVYDVEPGDPATGREPFYVMEYCEGGSLADRLKVDGRLPPGEVIPIVAAVSEGLAELHRRGLIHRDLKPANILFADGRPKLADFGISWSEGPRDGDPLTLPGSTLGTAPYLAPELAAGGPPSTATDVYALGVTTFQALTGQYPQSPGEDRGADWAGSPSAGPLPVSAAAPDLGNGFDAAIGRALDADPAARPSPTELADQLANSVAIWGGVARPNPGAIGGSSSALAAAADADMDAPTRVAPESAMPDAAAIAVPAAAALALEAAAEHAAPPDPAAVPAPTAAEPAAAQPVVAVPEDTAAPAAPPPRSARRRADPRPWADARSRQALVILVILAVLAVLLLPRLLGGAASTPGASPSAAPASPASSVAPSPSASTLANADAILAALGGVDAAIEAASGGKDGLKGRDANELTQLVSTVRAAVDRGDLAAAITATQKLSDRAQALAKSLDKQRRERLLAAIDTLKAALSSS